MPTKPYSLRKTFNLFAFLHHSHGIGMIQVLIASAMLGVVALISIQLMQNLNSSKSSTMKRVEVDQIKVSLTNLLSRPDICESTFAQILSTGSNAVTASSSAQTIGAPKIGTLKIGSQEIQKNDKYGDITITNYYLDNFVLDSGAPNTAYGDLVIKTLFNIDSKTEMEKTITIAPINFTLDSSQKITSCSANELGKDEICGYFGGTYDADKERCVDITLSGTTTNKGKLVGDTSEDSDGGRTTSSHGLALEMGTTESGKTEVTNVTLSNGKTMKLVCKNLLVGEPSIKIRTDSTTAHNGVTNTDAHSVSVTCPDASILVSAECYFKNCQDGRITDKTISDNDETVVCKGYSNSVDTLTGDGSCELFAQASCMITNSSTLQEICYFTSEER